MRKSILSISTFLICLPIFCSAAFASETDTVRVGLYFNGSSSYGALVSANLENYKETGSGYYFGYYDSNRDFIALGETQETTISMSQDVNLYVNSDGSYTTTEVEGADAIGCYHLQLNRVYDSYESAYATAEELVSVYGSAFPAYENGNYVVRIGSYLSRAEADAVWALGDLDATITSGTSYTVTVTKTGTNQILFEYDDAGRTNLAVEPRAVGDEKPQTWFKGYRYYGGFEYDRSSTLSGGKINVINVVDIEDYVKCVITWEMSASWPTEALKAQSVCARTYVLNQHKHDSKNFDVCSTTDCQVYRGAAATKDASNAAVDETAGLELYYNDVIIDATYYSSNGGASEDSENVWYSTIPYLRGKFDPYESLITIPAYSYEKTYTVSELTQLLQNKGYNIGTVASVTCEYTEMGNMYEMTFTDTDGKTVTIKKESCRFLFSVPSMRFTVTGSDGTVSGGNASTGSTTLLEYFINGISSKIESMKGIYTISGKGLITKCDEDSACVITSEGKTILGGAEEEKDSDSSNVYGSTAVTTGSSFTVSGTGSGHNVGMSQYGAYAMAKQGLSFKDILNFYYTGITIK